MSLKFIKRAARIAEQKQHNNYLPEDNKKELGSPSFLAEALRTPATIMAHSMGLQYYGFGRWGTNGTATHIENDDRTWLDSLDKPEKIIINPNLRKKNIEVGLSYSQSKIKPIGKVGKKNAKQVQADIEKNYFNKNLQSAMGNFITVPTKWDETKWEDVPQPNAPIAPHAPLQRYDLKKLIDDSEAQFSKLNDDEKKAVSAYTGHWYSQINKQLRTMGAVAAGNHAKMIDIERGINSWGEPAEFIQYMKGLSDAFKRFKLRQEVVVYRGVNPAEMKGVKRGDIINIQQYISTTISPSLGYTYGTPGQMLVIRAPKGTHGIFVAGYSNHASENELILDRGMQLKLRRIEIKINKEARNDAINDLRMKKGNNNPTRQEIIDYIEQANEGSSHYHSYRLNKTYVMEIVDNKKEVFEDELSNPAKFIVRHSPEPNPQDLALATNKFIKLKPGEYAPLVLPANVLQLGEKDKIEVPNYSKHLFISLHDKEKPLLAIDSMSDEDPYYIGKHLANLNNTEYFNNEMSRKAGLFRLEYDSWQNTMGIAAFAVSTKSKKERKLIMDAAQKYSTLIPGISVTIHFGNGEEIVIPSIADKPKPKAPKKLKVSQMVKKIGKHAQIGPKPIKTKAALMKHLSANLPSKVKLKKKK